MGGTQQKLHFLHPKKGFFRVPKHVLATLEKIYIFATANIADTAVHLQRKKSTEGIIHRFEQAVNETYSKIQTTEGDIHVFLFCEKLFRNVPISICDQIHCFIPDTNDNIRLEFLDIRKKRCLGIIAQI